MFKQLTILPVQPGPAASTPGTLEQRLADHPAAEPTLRARTFEFVPPTGEPGLVVGLQHKLICVRINEKLIPPYAIRAEFQRMCEAFESDRGFKPGAKQRRLLKDEAEFNLQPHALPRNTEIRVLITPQLLMLQSTKAADVDAIVNLLSGLDVIHEPDNAGAQNLNILMTAWLASGDAPGDLVIGQSAALKRMDDEPATARFTNQPLRDESVQHLLRGGYTCESLQLIYADRVSFTLNKDGTLRQIKVLDFMQPDDSHAPDIESDIATFAAHIEAIHRLLTVHPVDKPKPRQEPSDAELYQAAVSFVRQAESASISLLQRQLKIGYNQAARLMDRMQHNGVISAPDETGIRAVIPTQKPPGRSLAPPPAVIGAIIIAVITGVLLAIASERLPSGLPEAIRAVFLDSSAPEMASKPVEVWL